MTGTERKVFQKYYPPDFDPSKIPRAKGQRNRQFVQRVMAPFNMQCNTCHEYIYKGKKFNMRRETAEGEQYLGLKIFRFYFRCPNCLAEITFKTDLENCDYQEEHGATRLFEAFKLYQQEEKAKETKEEEEKKDPMKMLEKRTKMSRAEMEALGKLEELQEINKRAEFFDPSRYIEQMKNAEAEIYRREEEKDEEFVRKLFGRTEDGKVIKRILESDDDSDEGIASHKKLKVKTEAEESEDCMKPSTSTAHQISSSVPCIGQKCKVSDEKEKSKESRQRQLLSKIIIRKEFKEQVLDSSIQVKKEPKDDSKQIKEEPKDEFDEMKTSVNVKADSSSKNSVNALNSLAAYGSSTDSE